MQITLRKGDFDSCLNKHGIHRQGDFASYPRIVRGLSGPGTQGKVQGTLAETQEECCWSRLLQNVGVFPGSSHEEIDHPLRVRTVGHAYRNIDSPSRIGKRPVDDLIRDKVCIGHNHFRAFPGSNDGGTDSYVPHLPSKIIHLHPIADLNGSLEQQDQA